jgi:DHA1 family bicyclomycin/chloramphenicol resistance-like MFS transporter
MTGPLIVVVALLGAIAPFGTDIYLPTFPAMTGDLHASASLVQLTLTAFLLGAGVGQLVFGPISDRVGRRGPLIIGTAVCVAAGVAAALAPNIAVLIAARLVQGLSGASGMVLGRAIIADVAHGREAARAFSLTSVVQGVAPIVAPLIGSLLAAAIGWRGLLLVVAGLSAVSFAAVVFLVPETHPARQAAPVHRPALGGSGFRSPVFIGSALAFVFGFGAMMSYISASPFVYQVMVGMGTGVYGLVFGATALAITAVSFVAARLAHRFRAASMLRVGLAVLVSAAAVLGLLVALGAPPGWLIAPLVAGVASMGLVFGNATALALGAVPHAAGIGSAILGASQFVVGALVSPLVGVGGEHTAVPLAICFGASALIAAAAILLVRAPGHLTRVSSAGAGPTGRMGNA